MLVLMLVLLLMVVLIMFSSVVGRCIIEMLCS